MTKHAPMPLFLALAASLISCLSNLGSASAQQNAWGTLRGQVIFAGRQLPKRQPLQAVGKHQDQKHCLSKGPILNEDWVINEKNRGVRWVLVWLQTAGGTAPPIHPKLQKAPNNDVVIDQPCCMFIPHAVVVRQGQSLLVKNSSPITHSIKWTSFKNPGGNNSIAAGGAFTVKGLVADTLPVKLECALHSWMSGYAKVVDHPYAAVTDADGKFEMQLAPTGEYQLVTHHDIWGPGGRKGIKVTIQAGGVTDIGQIELK